MIAMAKELQLAKLKLLLHVYPENGQYAQDLEEIQVEVLAGFETPAQKQRRKEAEDRVKMVLIQHGEPVGHGDLMTFQKMNQAVMMCTNEVTAIDRLDFLGIFRLQIFHLVMAKTSMDIKAAMPDVNKVEDRGSLGNAAALLGILGWFCNDKKKIVRDDNYERHAQHLRAFQQALLINMYKNYIKISGVDPSSLKSRVEVQEFLTRMFTDFGAIWYWDVGSVDPKADRACDLFKASRDQVVRFALDLAFRQAQHQNDAMALRALRRVMCVIFCANTTKSNYAFYTLMDLVGV